MSYLDFSPACESGGLIFFDRLVKNSGIYLQVSRKFCKFALVKLKDIMEKRLNNLFDWDYKRLFAFSHEDIIHTYQTDETEKVFDEKITNCFNKLIIDTPAMCKLHIANDTMNDDLRYGDCTTQGYIVNSTDEFKQLIKSTSEQLVACMKNLIVHCNDNRRITSWWVIDYRKYRNGGYEGKISIRYDILSQPNERGASHIYRQYQYYLEFRTTRKDFHF